MFSWEQLSWSLYYDSLVAFHIIDHGKWWLKLRPRCFVNSRPLWYYWRWRIVLLYDAYSSKPIFLYWKFPRFSVDEWSDVDCKTEHRFAKKDLFELCECLGIPKKFICVHRIIEYICYYQTYIHTYPMLSEMSEYWNSVKMRVIKIHYHR